MILALLIAYTVAAFVRHEGDKFVDGTDIKNSSNGTFFWVHTFNLGTADIRSCADFDARGRSLLLTSCVRLLC